MEVEIELSYGDHAVDLVGFRAVVARKQIGERCGFFSFESGYDPLRLSGGRVRTLVPQVIFDEADIVLEDPVYAGRGPDPVGKSEFGSRFLSGRTDPSPRFILQVAVRYFLREPGQVFFRLALDKLYSVPMYDQKVRRMGYPKVLPIF